MTHALVAVVSFIVGWKLRPWFDDLKATISYLMNYDPY